MRNPKTPMGIHLHCLYGWKFHPGIPVEPGCYFRPTRANALSHPARKNRRTQAACAIKPYKDEVTGASPSPRDEVMGMGYGPGIGAGLPSVWAQTRHLLPPAVEPDCHFRPTRATGGRRREKSPGRATAAASVSPSRGARQNQPPVGVGVSAARRGRLPNRNPTILPLPAALADGR